MTKAQDENINFKEFMENEEESGLKNFKLIDENPSDDVQFIATLNGKVLIMKNNGSYILTKSENLVRNGFGKNENENFPESSNTNGEFSITVTKEAKIESSDFIKIDPNKKYYQAMIAKTDNVKSINYIGFTSYDCDRNLIRDNEWMYQPNSLTYLEKDLKPGDTEVYLHDVSGFIKSNILYQNQGLIFWNYKDSTGYKYPELTYSRNSFYSLFKDESFDLENNKIKLNSPWSYGTISAGTKVSQSNKGENHNYGIANATSLTSKYKLYENTITQTNTSGYNDRQKFNPGTKYIKIMYIVNYRGTSPSCKIDSKDIIFAEYE